MASPQKTYYLTNKEMLKAIHSSKNTYSSFTLPEYNQYDHILFDIGDIDEDSIITAKQNRAARLSREAHEAAQLEAGTKLQAKDFEIDFHTIKENDLIFRLMTHDHIPLSPTRKKTPKTVGDNHVKLNFPPFQHFHFTENKELVCIGKSHWKGTIEDGEFCTTHGKMTDHLAHIIIKIAKRYASKGNVRGYTYNDEMQGQAIMQLTYVALQFNEGKSLNPFAFFSTICTNSFLRVLNIEKRNQEMRDDILEMNGLNPSYTRQNSDNCGERASDGYSWVDYN